METCLKGLDYVCEKENFASSIDIVKLNCKFVSLANPSEAEKELVEILGSK